MEEIPKIPLKTPEILLSPAELPGGRGDRGIVFSYISIKIRGGEGGSKYDTGRGAGDR